MEKLVLRGVMWGADRVPDSWFEKIPGDYYKAKGNAAKKIQSHNMNGRSSQHQHRHRRRHSGGGGEDDRTGRRSRNDGYRSDGHSRRRSDRRMSYDGTDGGNDDGDEDMYDSINDRPRRRRSKSASYRKRDPRDPNDYRNGDLSGGRGYSYHNGAVEPPAYAPDGSYSSDPYFPHPEARVPSNSHPQPDHLDPENRSTSTLRGNMATGYVPYAHIYGDSSSSSVQGQFSPDFRDERPTYSGQMPPPPVGKRPDGYQQNPYAQQAPYGSQPAYIRDPQQAMERSEKHWDGGYDSDPDHSGPSHSSSTTRHDRSRRDDDFSSTNHSSSSSSKQRRRGKSRILDSIDTSKQGLGYKAVGALAGGLAGNELGKGILPTALGAAVGAVGGNAFSAREKRRETRRAQEDPMHSRSGRRAPRESGYYSD